MRRAGIKAADTGDLTLIDRAFLHESFSRERGGESYQRLEFLGDSVLGFIAATYVYAAMPDEAEGQLTLRKAAIVNDAALAVTAKRLGFDGLLSLGVGMRGAGGATNPQILADAFEAFVAALYLTYGAEAARRFVEREHIPHVDLAAETVLDPKTRLQHHAQQHLGATPSYIDEAVGSPQEPLFRARVEVNGAVLGSGSGPSKKAARQAAAEDALRSITGTKGST